MFVEVKTRNENSWFRPINAVTRAKKRRISHTALDYLRELDQPRIKIRFDVVEVLVEDDKIMEIRHIPNAFPLSAPLSFR